MDPSKGPLEPSLPKVKIGSKQKFTVTVAQEKDAAVLPLALTESREGLGPVAWV